MNKYCSTRDMHCTFCTHLQTKFIRMLTHARHKCSLVYVHLYKLDQRFSNCGLRDFFNDINSKSLMFFKLLYPINVNYVSHDRFLRENLG